MARFASIELGGTKVNIGIGSSPQDLSPMVAVPTTDPYTTMSAVIEALRKLVDQYGAFERLGVASFGPIALTSRHAQRGTFLNTPKPGWSGYNLIDPLRVAFGEVPIDLDTDVNAAALSEARWGAGLGLKTVVYMTIGTGVGVGVCIDGKTIKGYLHPETGHMLMKRLPHDQEFKGSCPFHGDCLEGLIAGPSIFARTGKYGQDLDASHPVWGLMGAYLGQALAQLVLCYSPERIIIGGGVGLNALILEPARAALVSNLNGYIYGIDEKMVREFVVPAGLHDKAGLLGGIALCLDAAAT